MARTDNTILSTYVPEPFAVELLRLARLNERSLSAEIRLALRRHLERELATQPKGAA